MPGPFDTGACPWPESLNRANSLPPKGCRSALVVMVRSSLKGTLFETQHVNDLLSQSESGRRQAFSVASQYLSEIGRVSQLKRSTSLQCFQEPRKYLAFWLTDNKIHEAVWSMAKPLAEQSDVSYLIENRLRTDNPIACAWKTPQAMEPLSSMASYDHYGKAPDECALASFSPKLTQLSCTDRCPLVQSLTGPLSIVRNSPRRGSR